MIWMTLLLSTAQATTRERALDLSAEFATHEWTMTVANETASCSSSYRSDFTAGTWVGIPYDWGGFATSEEFDQAMLDGEGAGSHSWHGVLSCTAGLDCSGFVSQAWETSQKYGTSTIYQITHDISAGGLKRADALNDAGSHIVLFAHQSDAGIPIHYETNGDVVFVDSDQGWSAFSGYAPIRADHIEEGPQTGTQSEPIEVSSFPLSDLRWTAGASSDVIDVYDCAPDTDESGPEMLYTFSVAEAGTLSLTVSDDATVDVDLHLLDSPDGAGCLARDDTELELWIEPGVYWISVDTYVGGHEFPGPYLLSGAFTGTLGDPPDEETGSSDEGDEEGSPGSHPPSEAAHVGGAPGEAVAWNQIGACSTSSQNPGRLSLLFALTGLILLGRRSRRKPQ